MIEEITKLILIALLFLILGWHSMILMAMYKAEDRSRLKRPRAIRLLISTNLIILTIAIIYLILQVIFV